MLRQRRVTRRIEVGRLPGHTVESRSIRKASSVSFATLLHGKKVKSEHNIQGQHEDSPRRSLLACHSPRYKIPAHLARKPDRGVDPALVSSVNAPMEHLRGIGGSGGWLTESGSGSWCTTGLSIAGLGARRAGAQHQPDYEPHGYRAEVRLHSCSPISISLQRDLFSHGLGPKILHPNGRDQTNRGRKLQNAGSFSQKKIEVNGNGGSIMSEPFSG